MITSKECRNALCYEIESGIFTRTSGRHSGSIAGGINADGYVQIYVHGKLYYAHRLAWLYVYGEWPSGQLDHVDGNRINNAIANLRIASQAENMKNTALRSDNKSGVTGVCRPKTSDKWLAQIEVEGKNIFLGRFSDFESAVNARKSAERQYGFHQNHGRVKSCA